MKKYFSSGLLLMLSFLLINIFSGCSKTDPVPQPTKYPAPYWAKDASGKYPLSMTAVIKVSDTLTVHLQQNDEVAAFINGECRGTGVQVKAGLDVLFNVVIQGTSSENSKITFKYYSNFNQNMYTTTDFLTFQVDGSFGSPDQPQVLPFVVVMK